MRNWKYLMMSLALTGATATFTGCIDTDEPNGISELRSAKSELIKAQAALRLADVEFRNAQTAMELAKVEGEKIANQAAELLVKKDQLELDLLTEVNDAKIKAELEKIEQERAKLAETYKATMLGLETATAKAQESYDNAIAAIEAAKKLISTEELVVLNKALTDLGDAKTKLTTASTAVETAQGNLLSALKAITTKNYEKDLNHKVKVAQSGVDAAQKVADKIQELIDKDVPTTNWENEVVELKEYVEGLEAQKAEAKNELDRIEAQNPYAAAEVNRLEEAADEANDAVIEYAKFELKIENPVVQGVLGRTEYTYPEGEFTNEEYVEERGALVGVLTQIEEWLEEIEENGVIDDEQLQHELIRLKAANTTKTTAQTTYNGHRTTWLAAVNTYKANPNAANEGTLQTASINAFGSSAPGYALRLTEPTREEVEEAVANLGLSLATDFGSYGALLAATINVEDISNVVNEGADYIALADALQKQYDAVKKIADDNKKVVDAAYTAYEDASDAYDALFEETNDLIDDLDIHIGNFETLITTLEGNIKNFLEFEGTKYDNYADFEDALKAALLTAEGAIVTAEGALATAEHNLELFEAGQYTEQYALKVAQEALDLATEDYKLKKAVYDNTYARVQEVITIILG